MEVTKNKLRREMHRQRQSLSPDQQQAAGEALSAHLLRLPGLTGGRRFAGYVASGGEIDPMPALLKLIGRGRRCYLPIIVPGRRPALRFGVFDASSRFAANRFGIPEPQVEPRHQLKAVELDWLFLPLVAFDRSGNLDIDACKPQFQWLKDCGCHGIAVGGSTGEGHTLNRDEFERLVDVAVSEVGAAIPVIAGIIVNSTQEAIERGKLAKAVGACGPTKGKLQHKHICRAVQYRPHLSAKF